MGTTLYACLISIFDKNVGALAQLEDPFYYSIDRGVGEADHVPLDTIIHTAPVQG